MKRAAIGRQVDLEGWKWVAAELITRGVTFGHDHEILWSFWLLISLKVDIDSKIITKCQEYDNPFLNAMIVTAYSDGFLRQKPKLRYGQGIDTGGSKWLEGLVARCSGYTKASFKGDFAEEFTHLADRKLRLVDFEAHLIKVKAEAGGAISRTRYGYDSDDDGDRDFDIDAGF